MAEIKPSDFSVTQSPAKEKPVATTTPTPTITDDAGFKIWKLSTSFDVNSSMQGVVVGVPSGTYPSADKAFYAQVLDNAQTGTYRWSDREWFSTYDAAKASVVKKFKDAAKAKLFPVA